MVYTLIQWNCLHSVGILIHVVFGRDTLCKQIQQGSWFNISECDCNGMMLAQTVKNV